MLVYYKMSFYMYSGVVAFVYSLYAGAKYYSLTGEGLVSPKVARQMIKKGEIQHVVDVRTKFEYDADHYPGAKHIPVTEMSKEKVKDLTGGVLVYCNTGQRARRAADLLRTYGVKNVYYIEKSHFSIKHTNDHYV